MELACQRDIEAAARNHQLMVAAVPLVTLAMSVAASGGAGLSRAAVVGFVTSVVRYAMVEGYGHWRNWYRQQVPVKLKVTIPVTVLFSPEEQYEAWRPSEGQLSKVIGEAIEQYEHPRIVARAVDDFLRDCIDSYTQKGKAMSGLAALSRSQPVIREHGGAVAEENVSAGDMSGVVQFRLDDQLRNASQDTRSEATKAFADAWRDRFKASADEGMQRKDSPSINMGEPISHAEEITHDGTDLVLRVSGQKNRSDAKRLAETTPFQSEAIAKAAEDVLRANSTDEEYER